MEDEKGVNIYQYKGENSGITPILEYWDERRIVLGLELMTALGMGTGYRYKGMDLSKIFPPNYNKSSGYPYPAKFYLYYKMLLEDVKSITSISIEAVD